MGVTTHLQLTWCCFRQNQISCSLEFLLGSILQMCVVKVETGKEEEDEGSMVAKHNSQRRIGARKGSFSGSELHILYLFFTFK